MRARTKEGERLKRLAKRYANDYADLQQYGTTDPDGGAAIKAAYAKARKVLFDAIDEATSVDLTPRAVSEGD